MAASPDFTIKNGVLKYVSDDYIKKNNGIFDIPNSVKSIGDFAFEGCKSLRRVTIHSSVKVIGDFAFDGCINLEEVTIPGSVEHIGSFALTNCTSLRHVTIHSPAKIGAIIDIANLINDGDMINDGDIDNLIFFNNHKDLEITVIATPGFETEAKNLEEKLQKEYRDIKIHIEYTHNTIKGDSEELAEPTQKEPSSTQTPFFKRKREEENNSNPTNKRKKTEEEETNYSPCSPS